MRYMLGVLTFLAGLFIFILIWGQFELATTARFIDAPTILFIGIAIVATLLATDELYACRVTVSSLFSKNISLTAKEAQNAVRLLRLLGKTVIYAALTSFVIGFISMLYNRPLPKSSNAIFAVNLPPVVVASSLRTARVRGVVSS